MNEVKSKAGYEYLITYQNAIKIYDLTLQFCDKYINKFSRTHDQMVQAARSAKQCIPEGYLQKSLKGYIKLLGVTRGSFEELLQDYYDFGRTKGIEVWDKWDKGVNRDKFGKYLLPFDSINPLDPFIPLNCLVNLIRVTNYMLDKQIASLEEKFIKEEGYTEKIFRKRLEYRK